MMRESKHVVCGKCGKKGAHLRSSYLHNRLMDAEGDFWIREVACRYCGTWTPLRSGDDWEAIAASWGSDEWESVGFARKAAKERV